MKLGFPHKDVSYYAITQLRVVILQRDWEEKLEYRFLVTDRPFYRNTVSKKKWILLFFGKISFSLPSAIVLLGCPALRRSWLFFWKRIFASAPRKDTDDKLCNVAKRPVKFVFFVPWWKDASRSLLCKMLANALYLYFQRKRVAMRHEPPHEIAAAFLSVFSDLRLRMRYRGPLDVVALTDVDSDGSCGRGILHNVGEQCFFFLHAG